MINHDFGPHLEISLIVDSRFVSKYSYQFLIGLYDFGLQHEIS